MAPVFGEDIKQTLRTRFCKRLATAAAPPRAPQNQKPPPELPDSGLARKMTSGT